MIKKFLIGSLLALSVVLALIVSDTGSLREERDKATAALASANSIIEVQNRTIDLQRDLLKLDVSCVTFEALSPGSFESVWARIGELQICGRELQWNTARGPNYETAIASRDAEIVRLKELLNEAK